MVNSEHPLFQRREATKMYHITSIVHARVRSVPYALESMNVSKFEVKRLEVSAATS